MNIHSISLKARGVYDNLFGIGIIPKKEIAQYLPEHPVILEAGAHTGKDTVQMVWAFKPTHIYAIEPVISVFKRLDVRTNSFLNITCYNLALGEFNGMSNMYVSCGASDASSSLLEPKEHLTNHPHVHFSSSELIRITTLDTFAFEKRIPKIDFMWLDLQGMELAVLKQGTHILKTVMAIYTEVSEGEEYEGQARYSELRDWLSGQGFKVEKESLQNGNGNVLFIRVKE